MKNIRISDVTICSYSAEEKTTLTFREKIEIAKLLDRLGVSVIELGALSGGTADNLLIKSVATSVKNSVIAVCPGFDPVRINGIWDAMKGAAHPRLQICAAVSTARLEYVYHMKADAMIKAASDAVALCGKLCENVEFIAEDATRADREYLCRMIGAAIDAGAGTVTVCDTAGVMLPDEFGDFIDSLYESVPALKNVVLGVKCSNALNVADASAVAAVRRGAGEIKTTALPLNTGSLPAMAKLLTEKANALDAACTLNTTEIGRILQSIERLCSKPADDRSPFENGVRQYPETMVFTKDDTLDDIVKGAEYLGYDLNDDDKMRIWKAFGKIAQKKDRVSVIELEAIIASDAMQAPAAYSLENYVITIGNAIDVIAHVKLRKGSEMLDGVSLGDGPIDAAFLAIENITGHHYELDDFLIQALTEGREAVGQTIVKLRSGGKLYSGKGTSTDVVGSAVAAYINALNKILHEEEQV